MGTVVIFLLVGLLRIPAWRLLSLELEELRFLGFLGRLDIVCRGMFMLFFNGNTVRRTFYCSFT